MSAPTFSAADRPAEVLDSAGRWLAANLPEFEWKKSRQDIERKRGDQTHRIGLQSSTWSRAGIATWVSPRLTILDSRLLRWRKAHPDLTTVKDPGKAWPTVFNSLFDNFLSYCSNLEASGLPQTSEGPSSIGLDDFQRCLVTAVLPVLEEFAEPDRLIGSLPASWWNVIDAGAVEWALALGDHQSAAQLVQRHLTRPLRGQQTAESRLDQFAGGWDDRMNGQPSSNPTFSTSALGWLSAAHELFDAAALKTLLTKLWEA